VTLLETTYAPAVRVYRNLLDSAARDPVNPKLEREYPEVPPGGAPDFEVAHFIRTWAKTGNDLYNAMFRSTSTTMQNDLQAVKASSDQPIQVIRFAYNFVYPWNLIYDYKLKEDLVGDAPKPVCLGYKSTPAGAVACGHGPGDETVVCVNGFWAIRQHLEEQIKNTWLDGQPVPKRAAASIRIVGDNAFGETGQLNTSLAKMAGVGQTEQGPYQDAKLLDLLWNDATRPSVLIFLSHLSNDIVAGQPNASRLLFSQGPHWLTEHAISNYLSHHVRWTQNPKPIVFLMACESAATTMETINDFVGAWHGCGASAILGSEAVIGSGLAADFAREVTRMLWEEKKNLGEAVTTFRRSLIRKGNPLAFLFQAIGDVDLKIQ